MIQQFQNKYGRNKNSRRYKPPNVPSIIIYNSQDVDTAQVSNSRWMSKEDVVCVCVCVCVCMHVCLLFRVRLFEPHGL